MCQYAFYITSGCLDAQFKLCLDVSALVKTATKLDSGMSELNLNEQSAFGCVCVCVLAFCLAWACACAKRLPLSLT